MNIETRHRHARKRRHTVIATAVIAAATACSSQPTAPVTAGALTDRDVVKLRALDPTPAPTHTTVKPRARAAHHQAARISTAVGIRRLRVTEYCYEGSTTSLGKQPWIGVAAVKKASGIPYGTHLVIAGKRYVVGDREPSFGVSDVDLYAGRGPSCEREAADFGIRHLNVTIERAA